MTTPKKLSSQKNHRDTQPDIPTSRQSIRNPESWEKSDFEELDLCMEVTAYVARCQ